MPYADVRFPNGSTDFANSSGVLGCGANPGPGPRPPQFLRTRLNGRYVKIADLCAPPPFVLDETSLANSARDFDIKAVMADAERARQYGTRTIVFIDEIHRFNKAQQDAFLPYVETRRHQSSDRSHHGESFL